jgi:hypothetical protein
VKEKNMHTTGHSDDGSSVGLNRNLPVALFASVVVALLLFNGIAEATSSPYKLCFREVTGLPVPTGGGGFTLPMNPPDINGVIDGDTGWTGAFRYAFQNGTNLPYGAVQAIKQGNKLYFSFQITQDNDFNQYDSVVLGFDNLNAADPHRYTYIVIQPLTDGFGATASTPLPANRVRYWQTNNPSSWPGSFSTDPAWITAEASSAGTPTNPPTAVLSWNLELSLDNSNPAGPNLPSGAGSAFALYMNAIRSFFTGPKDTQFAWPSGVFVVSTLDPSSSPPNPASWGNSTLDTSQACSGVYFDYFDIHNSILGASSNVISLNNPNQFSVNVHNSSSTSIAHGVTATFKIANFGLPSGPDWKPIGEFPPAPGTGHDDSVANNPTSPLDVPSAVPPGPPINPAGSRVMTAGTWTLSGTVTPPVGNKGFYSDISNEHQCILVELDSAVGDTTFVNRSTWNNFDVSATASEFKSYPATVSGNYLAIPGRSNQTLHLSVSRQELTPGGVGFPSFSAIANKPADSNEKDVHFLSYVVDGCRNTGDYLTIDGPPSFGPNRQLIPGPSKKFENCESVGAYGYVIRHVGPVNTWQYQLQAAGNGVELKPLGNDQFQLSIPQGKKAQLISTVTPSVIPLPKECFGHQAPSAAFALLGGIFVVGLLLYRPRRKEE